VTDLALTGVAYAEANWGRWLARCPRPLCTNALVLEVGEPMFVCAGLGGCGITAELIWPADPQAIEALLAMRPVSRTQNWVPGESLEDLVAENLAHDIVPPEWLALSEFDPQLVIADIQDQRVTGGLLHKQLVAAGRREIGA
jgi:hypothetical protein